MNHRENKTMGFLRLRNAGKIKIRLNHYLAHLELKLASTQQLRINVTLVPSLQLE